MGFNFFARAPDGPEFFARHEWQLIVEVRRSCLRRVAGTEDGLRADRVGKFDGRHVGIATDGIEAAIGTFVKVNRAENSKGIAGAAVGWQINFSAAKTVEDRKSTRLNSSH